ncbi:hypothetical protein AAK894_13165 [Lachnospiraceae bacterium 46-61]
MDTRRGEEGSKTVTMNALKGETTSITAILSNGETVTFEAKVGIQPCVGGVIRIY